MFGVNKKGGTGICSSLLPRECWKSHCELEQSILLNKGFDERRGSVLIWIRNLCLRAPFLSRLPSTTPLWFKAVFGFSSASQVITFQHVAPFRGGINLCCYFFILYTLGLWGTEKKKVLILTLSLHAHLHACLCILNVLFALCLFSQESRLHIANFRWMQGVRGPELGLLPDFIIDVPVMRGRKSL